MARQAIDYDKLAKEHGGTVVATPTVDYDALAREVVGTTEAAAPARFQTTNEKDAQGNAVVRSPTLWEWLTGRESEMPPDVKAEFDAARERMAGRQPPVSGDVLLENAADVVLGPLKGVGQTVVNLGKVASRVPGPWQLAGDPTAAFREADRLLESTSPMQAVGKSAEQMAEVFLPSTAVTKATQGLRFVPRVAAEAGVGGTMALVQNTDPKTGLALGAAGPVVGAGGTKAADWIGSQAVPLMRAGLKTPLSILNKQVGAGKDGLEFLTIKLAKFMVDNRLTTVSQATRLIKNAEADIQRIIAADPLVDAPQRVMQYLDLFKRRAAKTLTPDQTHVVSAYADELLEESVLGETVTKTVMQPSPTGLVTAGGQPVMVPVPVQTRALRTDMRATEALGTARETSAFQTKRQWGEQKGVAMEAVKTAERAARNAVKDALPEIRTPLQQQGMSILAKQVLDRRLLMEGNRDVLSLPAAGMAAAGASVNGFLGAVLGFATNWLRNNQRKAGVWADQLSKAIQTEDAATAAAILHRLGIGIGGQLTAQPAGR